MKLVHACIKQKYLLFSFLIALFAGIALLHPGLPPTHDGEYHVIRFYEFDKVLRAGNWYPRWAPDLNFTYGVPLFTYVYPLPNYVASLLHFLGASFIDSFKLEMFVATLIGGIFFYFFAKEFWGEKGGLVASAFYSFSPYHFVDIYVRGSVGEVWAIALFPVFLWSYTKFSKTHKKIYFVGATISLACIIFSHNILALMFFLFVLSYVLLLVLQSKQKTSILLHSLFIIIFSLGLTAIFWIPALFETRYVDGLQIYNIQKNFPDFFQLLFPSWGTGFFDNNLTNQMSVQIGTANLLVTVLSFIFFIKIPKINTTQRNIFLFFLFAFLITFFFITPFSLTLWNVIPLLHYFQFPWRLLSLLILISSFLAGSSFYRDRSFIWVILFLGILFLTTYDYAHPAFYHLRTDSHYTTRSNFIDGTNSPGNVFHTFWTPIFSARPQQQAVITKGEGSIFLTKKTAVKQQFIATLLSPSDITFSTSYFPAWKITVNNMPVMVKNNRGLLSISLPKGRFAIDVTFVTTLLETGASWITIVSCMALLVFALAKLTFVRKTIKNL